MLKNAEIKPNWTELNMLTILQQHVGTKLLTTDFELVVDVSQHPAGPFELQQEGKDLVVFGQAGVCDHHIVWPLNLWGRWRDENYIIYIVMDKTK